MSSVSLKERERVVDTVVTALRHVLDQREEVEIGEDTRLFADLGLDSTSVLELLMEVEDGLDLELDADSLEQHHFETVGTLSDFVLSQLAESP